MDNSQLYIGTVNGVVVCVDRADHGMLSGRFFHSYSLECTVFDNLEQLLFRMEELFDRLHFPFPSTNERVFAGSGIKNESGARIKETKQEKIMNDDELLKQHGELGSFIVRVQHRQNSSWQGRITWMEKKQTVYFRSVWEMMKLMESAIELVSPEENNEPEPTWPDDIM